MSTGRGLITEREREILQAGPDAEGVSDNHYYNVRHRIRERLNMLPQDVATLREHYPEAAEELEETVEEEKRGEPQPA